MGKAGIYSEKVAAFQKHEGRRAAKLRSADLSRMMKVAQRGMERYPCGLDGPAIRRRSGNKRRILEKKDLPFRCGLETQNFRPPQEAELIFSAYGHQGTDVCGLKIADGTITNYSNAPNQYDEPEGIFPDGKHTLVECNRHMEKPEGIQEIDIYKLALDGSGHLERLTFFADYPGFKATNPVVSDNGKFMAFQVAKKGDPAGVGRGLLIFDLEQFERSK